METLRVPLASWTAHLKPIAMLGGVVIMGAISVLTFESMSLGFERFMHQRVLDAPTPATPLTPPRKERRRPRQRRKRRTPTSPSRPRRSLSGERTSLACPGKSRNARRAERDRRLHQVQDGCHWRWQEPALGDHSLRLHLPQPAQRDRDQGQHCDPRPPRQGDRRRRGPA